MVEANADRGSEKYATNASAILLYPHNDPCTCQSTSIAELNAWLDISRSMVGLVVNRSYGMLRSFRDSLAWAKLWSSIDHVHHHHLA